MKMILCVFVLAFSAVGASEVYATPQIPETLTYEGKEYPIRNDLMADYFLKFPAKNPKRKGEMCSALWRGYRSIFEIINGHLYLKDIFTGGCSPEDSAISKVVPKGEKLAIDWFTGFLEAAYGEYNAENPYSFEFLEGWEKYSIFQITAGRFDEVRHFNNKAFLTFKKAQFSVYKKTKDYQEEVKKSTADGRRKRKDVDKDIEFWILSTTKKFLVS